MGSRTKPKNSSQYFFTYRALTINNRRNDSQWLWWLSRETRSFLCFNIVPHYTTYWPSGMCTVGIFKHVFFPRNKTDHPSRMTLVHRKTDSDDVEKKYRNDEKTSCSTYCDYKPKRRTRAGCNGKIWDGQRTFKTYVIRTGREIRVERCFSRPSVYSIEIGSSVPLENRSVGVFYALFWLWTRLVLVDFFCRLRACVLYNMTLARTFILYYIIAND